MLFYSVRFLSMDTQALMKSAAHLSFHGLYSFPSQEKLDVWEMVFRNIRAPDFSPLYNPQFWQNTVFIEQKLSQCIGYYDMVKRQLPQLPEAGLFKGVFEYYLGRQPDAEHTLMAVAADNPDLFWVPYDLGLINLQKKRLDLADAFFKVALKVSVDKTLDTMTTSALYLQQLAPIQTVKGVTARLNDARVRCILIRAMIHKTPQKIDSDTVRNMGFAVTYF